MPLVQTALLVLVVVALLVGEWLAIRPLPAAPVVRLDPVPAPPEESDRG